MKRVLFTIILFLSFCISVNALTGYAYCPDDEEPVNMRKGPSTSSDLIGSGITCNDTVEILNENPGSDWYQIKYKDLTGYASKKYIKLNKTVEEDGKVICIEDTSPLQMYSDLNRKNKIKYNSRNRKCSFNSIYNSSNKHNISISTKKYIK